MTDIINNFKKSVSQFTFILNGNYYIGSGFFYYDTNDDLKNGYFVTAAHCVMSIEENTYYKITEAYLQNPITNMWISININNIYIDGIADVALIKTNIDFTNYSSYCLKISDITANAGDMCAVIGNPGGYDEDSISIGHVRDGNYAEPGGYQITNCIYINAPGMGGNSGGPIINMYGRVIGIYTFGLNGGYEGFGGGSNCEVLKNTIKTLKTGVDNKIKLYLGLDWSIPSPFLIKNYYENTSNFKTIGVYIHAVSNLSPFYNYLSSGDLLLNCVVNNDNTNIDFGYIENQKTPGVLIYYPINTVITISYIKLNTTNIITSNITLNKTYNDVSNLIDGPLQTGKKSPMNITNNKIKVNNFIYI